MQSNIWRGASARIRAWWRPTNAIPHFSLPPPLCWFYFTLLRRAFAFAPRPIWFLPAAALGTVRWCLDREARSLSDALVRATGQRATRIGRWRTSWLRCYTYEAWLLLSIQPERVTAAWATAHVRCDRTLPPGGAILLSIHHTAGFLGSLRVSGMGGLFGSLTIESRGPDRFRALDATSRILTVLAQGRLQRTFGDRRFHVGPTPTERMRGTREALRHLQDGGYLSLQADNFWLGALPRPLLGHALPVAEGAPWLAERSGKPIIPWMIVPEKTGWRLWIGEPVAPTMDGVIGALEMSIRGAPASWERSMAMIWLNAPTVRAADTSARFLLKQ